MLTRGPGLQVVPAEAPVAPVLRCEGLVKRFGDRTAVNGVGFHIAPGETYGLLGPNGAGKTTTISMICGLLSVDAGEVHVAGHRLRDDPLAVKAAIGYVPQEVALYDDLDARENLTFFGRLYGLRGARLRERVDHALAMVGLETRAGDRVGSFSGGMKRRLNIAAGLLHEPALLVLDEPTAGVDPQSRNAILESVADLGRQGMAILYTTHYMEEADRLCDRIGILDEGKSVAEGSRAELIELLGERDHIRLAVTGPIELLAADAREIEGVDGADVGDGSVDLLVHGARRLLPRLFERAEARGVVVQRVDVDEPDLETVFLHLTGKGLRD
jgi:ABC-2 type transport system ATP-binding protein